MFASIGACSDELRREYSQIKVWFNNNRQQRTPKGKPRRVEKVLPSHARHPSDVIKAYAERAEEVAGMTLEDFIEIVTAERDRLAAVISGRAGSTGLGLGAYLRDRVDAIRGADDDRTRVERMRKLDAKIKEVSRLPCT